MNYRVDAARIRATRDREIERARQDARSEVAELVAGRDREMRRLQLLGLTYGAIADEVGCSRAQAYQALNPERREQWQQRRKHLHVYNGGRAA
jgi:hypothetical protein